MVYRVKFLMYTIYIVLHTIHMHIKRDIELKEEKNEAKRIAHIFQKYR